MASGKLGRSGLQGLDAVTGPSAQLQALKRVKCILTGHLSRKIESIQNGLVPQLAKILADVAEQRDFEVDVLTRLDQQQESLLTQVAQVLSVIAHGSRLASCSFLVIEC